MLMKCDAWDYIYNQGIREYSSIVTWDDIKLGFQATAQLSDDTFKESLGVIEQVMDPLYRKKAINAM